MDAGEMGAESAKGTGEIAGDLVAQQGVEVQAAGAEGEIVLEKESASTDVERGETDESTPRLHCQQTAADSGTVAAAARGTVETDKGVRENSDKGVKENTDKAVRKIPEWQRVSGLVPGMEEKMSRSERRHAVRKLFLRYEEMVREALAEHEKDSEKSERSFLWDPIATICLELQISRRGLSALLKELTGMSATDVVDKIRADKLVMKIEFELAEGLRFHLPGDPRLYGMAQDEDQWRTILMGITSKWRKRMGFDRAEWSVFHGFTNYSRLRRGLMLKYNGVTPVVAEQRILNRFAEFYEHANVLYQRKLQPREALLAFVGKPITDKWAKALKDRPRWIAEMRIKIGLHESLEKSADETIWQIPETVALTPTKTDEEIIALMAEHGHLLDNLDETLPTKFSPRE